MELTIGKNTVSPWLAGITDKVKAAIANTVKAVTENTAREAKRNAPKSPTMQILSATLKRKKRTRQRTTPGGLERSIEWQAKGDTGSIFCASNSNAAKYAFRIHEERYKTWRNRGPGTIAKGAHAREKFIERALETSEPKMQKKLERELERATK